MTWIIPVVCFLILNNGIACPIKVVCEMYLTRVNFLT